MSDFDAIVVGAGPGGSSAAYFLAQAGAKVLVIDKKAFPRAKVCGDGLTPRAVKVLDEIGVGVKLKNCPHVSGLRIVGAGRKLEIDFPSVTGFPAYGLVQKRLDLDNEVLSAATAAGAEVWTQTEAESAVLDDHKAVKGVKWVKKQKAPGGGVVKAEQGEVKAPLTIVADGASSSFGRTLGIHREESYPLGLAIRTYYKSHRESDDYFESWLELRKGKELLPGYGWVFPVGDGTVNVGVGMLTTYGRWRSVNLNHLQRAFVDMLTQRYGITHEDQTEPYKSGRLPMGGSVLKPFGPGFMLIGDAAGIVNPFTGEGIAYALETGKLAAHLATQALGSGETGDLSHYGKALRDEYAAYYRMGRLFTKVIGYPAALNAMCQVGLRSKTVMQFVFQIMANLYEQSGGRLADRSFRAALRLSAKDLPN